VLSAELRKSITDLTRRRARTAFTVATLALAVASVSFLAIPSVIDASMQDEVRAESLADATVTMRPLPLTDAQLTELAALPNVAAIEPGIRVNGRVLVGERRAPALVIGVRDFAGQGVDVVRLASGAYPGPGEVLTDVQNANVGVYDGRPGQRVRVVGAGDLRITGEAHNIPGGEEVQDEHVIVLYATTDTIAALGGARGYDRLAIRLRDPGRGTGTVESVRRYLSTVPGFTGFAGLPELRAPGDWPGKADTEAFAKFLGVITMLALLSALVLVSNTMTTLIAEQTGEIGIMRAIGARRRQVGLVYLRTAALIGALGTVVGVVLGILLAYALAGFFGQTYWAIDVAFAVDLPVVLASVALGVLVPVLAALPAIRRGVKVDLLLALESTGSAIGGRSAGESVLRGATFLPRTMQIGLRSLGRRRRRSIATVVIVALAVGNLLAVLAMAASATEAARSSWENHLEDLRLWTTGREPFDAKALHTIVTTPGVARAQPALISDADLSGYEAFLWGVPRAPLLRYRLSDGRWFSAAEERGRDRVAVIERNLAEGVGVDVGDEVTLSTVAGPLRLRIVGLATNQQEDGTVLYLPLTTLRSALDQPTGVSTYWIETTSSDEGLIDRTTTLLDDGLTALGYDVATEISYVMERDEIEANSMITTTIGVLGFVIVAMSMVGLANAITMSILERTREIGILRCLGARARDVRRIFATEGLTLALVGWLAGIPLGYGLSRLLIRLVWEVVGVRLPFVFPFANVWIALAGTLALAVLVLLLPLRRAVRLRPGEALRYA
jgi:putative ABC transport system permease protein